MATLRVRTREVFIWLYCAFAPGYAVMLEEADSYPVSIYHASGACLDYMNGPLTSIWVLMRGRWTSYGPSVVTYHPSLVLLWHSSTIQNHPCRSRLVTPPFLNNRRTWAGPPESYIWRQGLPLFSYPPPGPALAFLLPQAQTKKKKRKEKNLRGGRSASSGGLLALQTCPREGDRGRGERRGVARPSAALPAGRALHLSLLCQSQSSLWISVLHYSPLLFQISPPKVFCRCFPTQSIWNVNWALVIVACKCPSSAGPLMQTCQCSTTLYAIPVLGLQNHSANAPQCSPWACWGVDFWFPPVLECVATSTYTVSIPVQDTYGCRELQWLDLYIWWPIGPTLFFSRLSLEGSGSEKVIPRVPVNASEALTLMWLKMMM